MAMRRPGRWAAEPAPDPTGQPVPISDVLARASGMNPSLTFDERAEVVAAGRDDTVADWAGRPCLSQAGARQLLAELRQAHEESQARMARQDAQSNEVLVLPAGVVAYERPGERTIYAEGFEPRELDEVIRP